MLSDWSQTSLLRYSDELSTKRSPKGLVTRQKPNHTMSLFFINKNNHTITSMIHEFLFICNKCLNYVVVSLPRPWDSTNWLGDQVYEEYLRVL